MHPSSALHRSMPLHLASLNHRVLHRHIFAHCIVACSRRVRTDCMLCVLCRVLCPLCNLLRSALRSSRKLWPKDSRYDLRVRFACDGCLPCSLHWRLTCRRPLRRRQQPQRATQQSAIHAAASCFCPSLPPLPFLLVPAPLHCYTRLYVQCEPTTLAIPRSE